jgi:PEP-CTERM motif
MQRQIWVFVMIAAVCLATTHSSVRGAVITSFSFDQLATGINNSPAPSSGAGTATPLSMTNNFTSPASTTNADVLVNPGSSNPSATNQAWRIRGAGTGSGNGWAAAAPQYSQGAEFLTSTLGFKDIVLTYDWSPTTQGVKHQQVQYTTNGSSWTNIGPLQVGPASEAWVNGITIDLSAIPAVNNNPLFGARIVSAYAPSGPNAGQYVNLAGSVINSTSGNWRFDTITFAGNAVPEPSTMLTIGTALVCAGGMFRRRNS